MQRFAIIGVIRGQNFSSGSAHESMTKLSAVLRQFGDPLNLE